MLLLLLAPCSKLPSFWILEQVTGSPVCLGYAPHQRQIMQQIHAAQLNFENLVTQTHTKVDDTSKLEYDQNQNLQSSHLANSVDICTEQVIDLTSNLSFQTCRLWACDTEGYCSLNWRIWFNLLGKVGEVLLDHLASTRPVTVMKPFALCKAKPRVIHVLLDQKSLASTEKCRIIINSCEHSGLILSFLTRH